MQYTKEEKATKAKARAKANGTTKEAGTTSKIGMEKEMDLEQLEQAMTTESTSKVIEMLKTSLEETDEGQFPCR